jgi:Effector-associated domain 11
MNKKLNKMTVKEFREQVIELIGENKTDEAIKALENRFKQDNDDDLLPIITVIRGEFKGLKNEALRGIIDDKELRQATVKINNRLLNVLKEIEDKTGVYPAEVVAACKAAKGLLMYLSDNTNSKTVFYEDANKNYWLRKAQGQAFIDVLSEFSLVEGHGKHLPKAIKKDFYSFRGKVYKIMEEAKINQDFSDEILIKNADMKAFVTAIRNQISDKLKPYL